MWLTLLTALTVFGRRLKTFPFSEYQYIQHIRGFGGDALCIFTFYDDITLCGCYYKLVKLDSLALYWNCGSECYTTRDTGCYTTRVDVAWMSFLQPMYPHQSTERNTNH